jgi:phosphinothricin acetyltransferase
MLVIELYRQGRAALSFVAEISYYIASADHPRGIGTALVEHALSACPGLQIRHLFAIILEGDRGSVRLLHKMGLAQWGYLPRVAGFDGKEVGYRYYGRYV